MKKKVLKKAQKGTQVDTVNTQITRPKIFVDSVNTTSKEETKRKFKELINKPTKPLFPTPPKKSTGGRIERLEGRAERVMGRAQKNWGKAQDALKYDETNNPETSNAIGYANRKLNQAARQEDRAKRIMAKANKLKAIDPATGGIMQRKGGAIMRKGGAKKK